MIPVLYDTRVAEDNRMRGYIHIHKTVRGNQNIITYGHLSHYRGIYADPDPIPDDRSSSFGTTVRLTDNNAFVNIAITSYSGS